MCSRSQPRDLIGFTHRSLPCTGTGQLRLAWLASTEGLGVNAGEWAVLRPPLPLDCLLDDSVGAPPASVCEEKTRAIAICLSASLDPKPWRPSRPDTDTDTDLCLISTGKGTEKVTERTAYRSSSSAPPLPSLRLDHVLHTPLYHREVASSATLPHKLPLTLNANP